MEASIRISCLQLLFRRCHNVTKHVYFHQNTSARKQRREREHKESNDEGTSSLGFPRLIHRVSSSHFPRSATQHTSVNTFFPFAVTQEAERRAAGRVRSRSLEEKVKKTTRLICFSFIFLHTYRIKHMLI